MGKYLTKEELRDAYMKGQASRETRDFPIERVIADKASDKAYAEGQADKEREILAHLAEARANFLDIAELIAWLNKPK